MVKAEKLLINDKNCSLNRSWKFEERLKMNKIEGWSRQCLSIDISQPSATAMQQNYNHHHAISISVSKCISKLGSLFVMSCRSLSIYHLHQVLYICIILYPYYMFKKIQVKLMLKPILKINFIWSMQLGSDYKFAIRIF